MYLTIFLFVEMSDALFFHEIELGQHFSQLFQVGESTKRESVDTPSIYLRSVGAGHGRLVEPPNRSSLWRFGYGTPANYDDNGLNCGGFDQQWSVNGGKCGVCGDPYNGARQHEDGGQYASGIITGNYEEGQVIKTQVLITANHLGWFEFRICPLQQVSDYKSVKECLDENVLELADGTGVRYDLSTQRGDVTVELFLPPGVVCKHCLLQWKWHCGNNWGTSAGGVGCVGCGAQEEFYGCADVTIQPRGGWHNTSSTPPASTTPSTRKPSTTDQSPPLTVAPHKQVCKATGAWAGQLAIDMWCESNCAKGYCPSSHCVCLRVEEVGSSTQTVTDPSSTPTGQKKCAATGDWLGVSRMDEWCVANCASGYCPASYCACVTNPSTSSAASTSTPSPFSTQPTTPNRTVNASTTTTSTITATTSPQNVTTTSSNVTHFSLNVTTTPYKVTETPQNATTSPYNVTENPHITTLASQNVTGNSQNATTQNVTRTPQNTTTTPYNVTETSQIATTMSYNVTETLKNATSTSYNVTDTPQISTSRPYDTAGNAVSTRHTVTQVSQSATTSALNSCAVYKSINGTGGSFFDSYCHITCSLSLADCPLDSCTCADNGDATPPTTSCRPLDEYADLPYFDQFCSLMCIADACDDEYCSCK